MNPANKSHNEGSKQLVEKSIVPQKILLWHSVSKKKKKKLTDQR